MDSLIDKKISLSQFSKVHRINMDDDDDDDDDSNNHKKRNNHYIYRLSRWFGLIKRRQQKTILEGRIIFGNKSKKNENVCINDIPFIIPRQLQDVRKERQNDFDRAKLIIRRMDEYLVSPEDHNQAKRQRHQDTSVGLQALAAVADTIQKLSFREVLSLGETLQDATRQISKDDPSADHLSQQQREKIDPITDFQEAHDFIEFDEALHQHHEDLLKQTPTKPSDMLYLKFCLILELQRDEYESCLRILLHDIIFKFHLSDFRIRCEIHIRKPIDDELIIEKTVHDSHLKSDYSAQFILTSGDWITEQDVELYIVMKIESLSINKYMSSKFWDMTHLHVKNVPHGSSRIFLRELTPVSRPYRLLSRGINVGQIEIEATHGSINHQLSIRIVKISHSQAERFLRAPETYVEVIFQGPFSIYDIKRTKLADRSLNPIFNEEFLFDIPENRAISDITVDLIFLEKSSLSHSPSVLGVLTLSKHTDWFPVRKFWSDLEENPNITLKNSFLFEGNECDD